MPCAEQSLGGTWQLTFFPQGSVAVSHPNDLPSPEQLAALGLERAGSIPATVPGNVELDLVAAGLLPEPFYASNMLLLQPWELGEWWYQLHFTPNSELTEGAKGFELAFDGVDCFATYWLNGELLGETDNMLVEHALDASKALMAGQQNTLTIRLRSAVLEARKYPYSPGVSAMSINAESLWVRKAPHMYGWDIMPRVVSAGLWRGVTLRAIPERRISDLYFATIEASEDSAWVVMACTLNMPDPDLSSYSLRVELWGDAASGADEAAPVATHTFPVHFVGVRHEFSVHKPKLWWPRGYGEQPLYRLRVTLLKAPASPGGEPTEVTSQSILIGIRKAELKRTETMEILPSGEAVGDFIFRVNGVPIMVMGSNWVPADAFHSRDAARIPAMLDLFADLGCNMLRCWGGNVYEDTPFYETCDRLGIMVWQDFSMACAMYPQAETFAQALRAEATKVVAKLRHHPSIVVWSGDNECDESAARLATHRNALTRDVLPDVVAAQDPYRPYLPSSPYFAFEAMQRGSAGIRPETHNWGVRDYHKSPFYTSGHECFVSEIGYHGCPNVSSIERFLTPEALWPYSDNEQWRIHATDPIPGTSHYGYRVGLMASQVGELFGSVPENLADFALASQISQAEAFKFFIEATRIRKWTRTGIIWWNCIDGWPQFSDAVVDYYFGKKLAYYYIKRSQQPFCPIVAEPSNWGCQVHVCNDTRQDLRGHLEVTDAMTGGVLLRSDVRSGSNANASAGSIGISRGAKTLFLLKLDTDKGVFTNHYVSGFSPLDLETYRGWIKQIAALDGLFDPNSIAK